MMDRYKLIAIYMNKEMTTCEVADSVEAYKCITEEQCDHCFMIDHLKECEWCEHYDHPVRKLQVQYLPSDYPTDAPSVDDLLTHLSKTTGFRLEDTEDEGDRIAADYADANPSHDGEE
jgi:hypothetical protein